MIDSVQRRMFFRLHMVLKEDSNDFDFGWYFAAVLDLVAVLLP